MIARTFYYRQIHITSGNAPFFVIFVCLSVCLSHTSVPFNYSVLERRNLTYTSI